MLNAAEWAALDAAVARILPSDDGPGAREADVVSFIDQQLLTHELAPIARIFAQGAQLLDKWADHRYGHPFAALDGAHQDEILTALARAEIPVKSFPQKEFFLTLHNLTLEGFLSDPIYGGNADGVGWSYIGFPEPLRRRPRSLPVVK
jgi:gluconate 2-dehydrogenase gamma chain